jgi:hypothetical protein
MFLHHIFVIIYDYILSPINMKQNKARPYQVCFLSTGDFVSKDKDRIKRDTLIPGNDSVDQQSQLISGTKNIRHDLYVHTQIKL